MVSVTLVIFAILLFVLIFKRGISFFISSLASIFVFHLSTGNMLGLIELSVDAV